MKAPELIQTERLLLRKPTAGDAEDLFRRFAGDPEVTRYLSWPTHQSVADTRAFLAWSDAQWDRWPAGPYLVLARDGRGEPLLGSTGLAYSRAASASTGYVFAKEAWGQGFATETLKAMVELASQAGVSRLEAVCHTEHAASLRVLEKCGFSREQILPGHTPFPNLSPGMRSDVFLYAFLL